MITPLTEYLTPAQTAEVTGYSTSRLAKWRMTWPDGKRLGPRFRKPKGSNQIRYSLTDIHQWMDEGIQDHQLQRQETKLRAIS